MKYLSHALKFLLVFLFFSSFSMPLFSPSRPAAERMMLHGKVTTIDGETFTGQIRWGDEEATWGDLFNSQKPDNPYLKYLDHDEVRREENDDDNAWGRFNIIWQDRGRNSWTWNSSSNSHIFACFFGEIAEMRITGRRAVELTLKNGESIEVEGGSNDVGEKITLFDAEIGKMELEWDRLDKIEFMQMPTGERVQMGDPLYGVVKTREGTFEGYVQWDEDEAMTDDKLDGESRNGDLSIPFYNIKSITRGGRGSDVVLKTERKLYLTGSNDVNSENRGIIVKNPEFGRLEVTWREFESIEFTEPKKVAMTYDDFKAPKRIEGSVKTTEGKTFTGLLAYDLDETYDFEMLDGKFEDMEYKVPFRLIKSIKPKNFEYSNVTLRSGKTLLLGDSQDVSDRNSGILVFKNEDDKDPMYIKWENLDEITFN